MGRGRRGSTHAWVLLAALSSLGAACGESNPAATGAVSAGPRGVGGEAGSAGAGAPGVSSPTAFCVDGWCGLNPTPLFAAIVDAVLVDEEGWVGTTGRQVVAKTSQGLLPVGPPLPGVIRRIVGTSLSDLYVAVDFAEDRVWHFDGLGWSSLGRVPGVEAKGRVTRGLERGPSGAVYLLDEGGDITRFDGVEATLRPAKAPWVDIQHFAVVEGDALVGVSKTEKLVKMTDAATTEQTLTWGEQGASGGLITGLVARSLDDVLVSALNGVVHVVGPDAHTHAGAVMALTTDPITAGDVVLWGSFGGQLGLYRLSGEIIAAEPQVEDVAVAGKFWAEVRARGDRRLVFEPGAHANHVAERSGGSWSSPAQSWLPASHRGPIPGASGSDFDIAWIGGFFHSDGQTLTPAVPPPGAAPGFHLLFRDGASLVGLEGKTGRFSRRTGGQWQDLPALPSPVFLTPFAAAATSTSHVFITVGDGGGIKTPGTGHAGPRQAIAHFDGAAWSTSTAGDCQVSDLAAFATGGVAAAGTCGVAEFVNGQWGFVPGTTDGAGTGGIDVRSVAATPSGAWLAFSSWGGPAMLFADGLLASVPGPDLGADVRLLASGEEFFAWPRKDTANRSIRRFNRVNKSWESLAPMPFCAGATWEGLLVADDAFVLTSEAGDIVRRLR